MRRREMLQIALSSAALAARPWPGATIRAAGASQRKFTLDLCPGRIGVQADQVQTINYAARYGFESVEPRGPYLAALESSELAELKERLASAGLVWGAGGIPVNIQRDEQMFRSGMKQLPRIAQGFQRAGVTRVGTWINPRSDQLTYLQNFRQHIVRLKQVTSVLADYGLRFGLEYIGPKTLWSSGRFPFIHSLREAQELIAEVGADNLGLVLDSWHWYTAGEDVDDFASLTNRDVVAVDLNDAPQGIERDQQIDSRRELPLASGVINLQGFLNVLVNIGYDGPVRAEPFNRQLNEMADEAALQATADAMQRAFALLA